MSAFWAGFIDLWFAMDHLFILMKSDSHKGRKREIVLWAVLGGLLGAWMGLNLQQGQHLFANPFQDPAGSAAMADALQEAYRQTLLESESFSRRD